jgi:hypothetical protein
MKRRLVAGLAAIVAATATILTASGAAAATPDVTTAGAPDVGTANAKLPAAIQVDETQNKVVASFVGIGKQVYDCNAGGTRSPSASRSPGLLLARGSCGNSRQGPVLGELRRLARGRLRCCVTRRHRIRLENVPWLKARSTHCGAAGVFSNVTFIQRLDTRGGVAPTGTCTAPKTVAVDYTANYVFWAKK